MLQPTMMSGGDAPEGEDVIRYGEENAIVLDRWLYDVCGEEDMRFPSHRRAQFAPYMQRVRSIVKQKDFLQGSFAYPSRSGTRETLVLQKTLEALGLRETRLLRERQRVEDNLARVERVLQQSALPRPFLASPPTQETEARKQLKEEEQNKEEEIEVKEEEGHREEEEEEGKEKMRTPIVTSPASQGGDDNEEAIKEEEEAEPQAETKEDEEGKEETPQPPHSNTTTVVVEDVTDEGTKDVKVEEVQEEPPLPALPLTETAEYKEKQRLAARYVDELGDKLRQMKEQHAALLSRHQHLLEQDAAVERELRDLSDTEAQLRSREEELRAQATEREGTLHDLQRQWQELSEKNEGVALIEEEEEEEESGAMAMRERLAELRRHLSEVSVTAQETRNTMLREEQAHLTRFRLSRERLKEWQDIVANLRSTAHQLEGQVRVLTRVVRDGALRMHEKPGEGGFLDRLQHNITTTTTTTPNVFTHSDSGNVQELSPPGPHTAGASITSAGRATSVTSAEPIHASSNNNNTLTRAAIMSRTGQANTSGNAVGSMTPTLMPLSSSSAASVPRHRAASCSTMSLTSTPNSKRPTTRGQESATGHRSRYDLVSHLQRWATVLEEDRVRLVQAAGLVPSPDGAIGPNVQSPPVGSSVQTRQAQMRHSFALLKSILLARITDEA